MSEWISVEDRLPNVGAEVLVYQNHGDSEYRSMYKWDRWWEANNVTHWMPLPEPPLGEEE